MTHAYRAEASLPADLETPVQPDHCWVRKCLSVNEGGDVALGAKDEAGGGS